MYSNDEVNWYLKELSTSPTHLKLLDSTLGRVFKYATARGEDWRMVCTDIQARQVSDWLSTSLRTNAPWLESVDSAGRISKLAKMKTIDQMTNEARKFMARNAVRKVKTTPLEQDFSMLPMAV